MPTSYPDKPKRLPNTQIIGHTLPTRKTHIPQTAAHIGTSSDLHCPDLSRRQSLAMSTPRPFFRPTSPKNCTVEFSLPIEVVRKLQRLAVRGRRSDKKLCQDVLAAFAETIFTGASFHQFRTGVRAKVAKPEFLALQDESELLTLEIAEHYRKKGNRPLPRRLAKAGKITKAMAWNWAKTKPKEFWLRA